MERLCHAPFHYAFRCSAELFQDAKQITEQFTSNEVVIDEAVMLLDCVGRVVLDPRIEKWHFQTHSPSGGVVDPHIEIAMDHAAGPEVLIDFEEDVLGMGLQEQASFLD